MSIMTVDRNFYEIMYAITLKQYQDMGVQTPHTFTQNAMRHSFVCHEDAALRDYDKPAHGLDPWDAQTDWTA